MFGDDEIVKPVPVLFFVSYMLIGSIVLINIIIAVLLDGNQPPTTIRRTHPSQTLVPSQVCAHVKISAHR